MEASRFITASLQDERVVRVLGSAIDTADPARLVKAWLTENTLPPADRIFALGIGKAAELMVRAALATVPGISGALAVTKQALPKAADGTGPSQPRLVVLEAGHPVPDERSLQAGTRVAAFISRLTSSDLLLCLISGGGSALVASPVPGVSLADLQLLTAALLASGATIREMNVVRRSLDTLKGGGILRRTRAKVLSLVISDVIGNSLEDIASGPTVLVESSGAHGLEVLRAHQIDTTPAIRKALQDQIPDTAARRDNVESVIIADNRLAIEAAAACANAEGLHGEIIGSGIQGEASVMGVQLAGRLRAEAQSRPRPFCLVAGGETTVTLGKDEAGTGGRNQELALAAVDHIAGLAHSLLIAMATDGNDGSTDAAGAAVAGETRARGRHLGLYAETYLRAHDSFRYFEPLGDLLKPGYTGTNVNDIILLVGL
jgi:glycerate 2-kinase